MPDKYIGLNEKNTGDLCKKSCADAGFRYAGTEATNQCFCGNTIRDYPKTSGCDRRCPGNNTEFCGGQWRISIYDTQGESYVPDGYIGCFEDSSDRIMPDRFYKYFGTNTGDKCIAMCKSEGFRYAATQDGWACFCSNTIKRKVEAEGCTDPCAGRNDEFCGGFWRSSIYDTQWKEPKSLTSQTTADYSDEVAQAFCTGHSQGFVFIRKRNCTSALTCNHICESVSEDAVSFLKDTVTRTACFDAVHIYRNVTFLMSEPSGEQSDISKSGILTYGYGLDGCSWKSKKCGPNYCCCRAL